MRYKVIGLVPAQSKQANEFMKVCGLGIEGAFIHKTHNVELSSTEKDTAKVSAFLKEYYENALGWCAVVVTSLD